MSERGELIPQTNTLLGIEDKGPAQTGEDAPTNTPAGPEHIDDGNTPSAGYASENLKFSNETDEDVHSSWTRRRRIIGAGAAAVTLAGGAFFLGIKTSGGETDEQSVPKKPAAAPRTTESQPSPSPSAEPTPEFSAEPQPPTEAELFMAKIQTLKPDEYYLPPTTEQPQELVEQLCQGINAAYNSVDENGKPRVDALGPLFHSESQDKLNEYRQGIYSFYSSYKQQDPGAKYYIDCQLINARQGGWGAYWTVDIERKEYVFGTEGNKMYEQEEPVTEQWDIRSPEGYVTLPDGTEVMGAQFGVIRPIEGWGGYTEVPSDPLS